MKLLSALTLVLVAAVLVCCPTVFAGEGKKKAFPAKPLDVNTASKAELMSMPGIGEKTADAIIEGRPYSSVDDLTKVRGISEKRLLKLRPHLTVGKAAAAAPAAAAPAEVTEKKEEQKAEGAAEMPKAAE